MTKSEILSKLKSLNKFTGYSGAFMGTVTPLSFHDDYMIVECRKGRRKWKEKWDVLITIWGFESGDYKFIKQGGGNGQE